MKISAIRLYTIRSGNTGERGAEFAESQYWGGGWQTHAKIANPMSVYSKYARLRSLWMGPGQDPYVIEILADDDVSGFAANYGRGAALRLIIERHFSHFLIGEDPFNMEKRWDQMYRSTLPYGLGGVTAMAMSGVDLALWDLIGKSLHQPVYKLLGGQTKETIPCYVTTHPDLVASWKDTGFLGVKIAAPWGMADRREGLVNMQRCLEGCRTQLGDEMELMVDCYLSWGLEFATRLAERVLDLDINWFENPLENGSAEQLNAELRAQILSRWLSAIWGSITRHSQRFWPREPAMSFNPSCSGAVG